MLKMNELSKLTNTPKSTILYYVKEGLLPEPLKDKPNFHLYGENNIQLIEFIKYLQNNFGASISQIKTLFAKPNFDANNPHASLAESLDTLSKVESEKFLPSELCETFGITEVELNELVEMGLIKSHNGIFTQREKDILYMISHCDAEEYQLLQTYAETAKKLAQQEEAIRQNILNEPEEQNERLKHFFDILLLFKPYALNLHTANIAK